VCRAKGNVPNVGRQNQKNPIFIFTVTPENENCFSSSLPKLWLQSWLVGLWQWA